MKSKTIAWRLWLLCSVVSVVAAGCPPMPSDKSAPTPPVVDVTPVANSITAAVVAARAEQSAAYAAALRSLADEVEAGRVLYATKLQLELDLAARGAAAPVHKIFADNFPRDGELTDKAKTAAALRAIGAAYQ